MMAWGWFSLALVVTFVVQTAAMQALAPAWADLLLALALAYGLKAPVADGRLAGWIIGFAQDVGSSGPLGLHAFATGLAVLLLTWLRQQVNLELWWGRWLIAFAAAFPARLIVHLHERLLQGSHISWGVVLGGAIVTALLAGLLAAVAVWLPSLWGHRRRRHASPRW